MSHSRRSFLGAAAAGSLLATVTPRAWTQDEPVPDSGEATGKLHILFIGGTGFLGPWTVREALARGHQVTLFNRGRTNAQLFPELEKLVGDREQDGDIDILVGRTFDAVIDTSGYVPAHVEASASLLAENVGQYVYFSSVSVYADHGQPADEESPVIELSPEVIAGMKTFRESLAQYGGMKAHCEQAAEAAMPGRVTVIRPGLIVGPGDFSDRFTYWAVRTARGGEVLAPGDGSDPVQFIDVRDLASWTVHVIENNITGTYNGICPAGRFSMAELLHGMKAAVTTDARFTWVDAEFLTEQGVQQWTDLPVWIHAVGDYAGFHRVNTARAVRNGLVFRPLAETAADTVAWCDQERGADYEFGARPGRAGLSSKREAELLAAWHGRQAEKEEF